MEEGSLSNATFYCSFKAPFSVRVMLKKVHQSFKKIRIHWIVLLENSFRLDLAFDYVKLKATSFPIPYSLFPEFVAVSSALGGGPGLPPGTTSR